MYSAVVAASRRAEQQQQQQHARSRKRRRKEIDCDVALALAMVPSSELFALFCLARASVADPSSFYREWERDGIPRRPFERRRGERRACGGEKEGEVKELFEEKNEL